MGVQDDGDAAGRALEASERRYRALFEASFHAFAVSIDHKLVYTNQACVDLFGYTREELIGKSPIDLATPASAESIVDNIRNGVEAPYEAVCVRKDGSTFPVELIGRAIELDGKPARLTSCRDLTEERRAKAEQERREERVRHAQKLETLGVLAGGIAHDFNNLLAVIRACADLGMRNLSNTDRVAGSLGQIAEAVDRATDLTEQLMMYAGRGERETESVDLSALVRDAVQLLRVSVQKQVVLTLELAPELPAVDADRTQLHQVVMNLVVNASESIGDESGEISVVTGVVTAGDGDAVGFYDVELPAGSYAFFEVSDTGVGMDTATVSRIFDPFFTTKFAGRGLGLAAVQGIVRGHGGAIHVDSGPGRGTRFRVLLPSAS